MPELPEVETVKRVLKNDIISRTIKTIDIYYGKIIKNVTEDEFKNSLIDQTFINIERVGKYLIFELNDYYMVAHLRMEGKYFLMKDETISKHDHIIFCFYDGFNLRYNDVRKFGVIYLFKKCEYKTVLDLKKIYPLNEVGLEPFDKEMSVLYLKEKFKNCKLPLKSALLDQSIIAGLGNIYADEVIYMSHLHPLDLPYQLNDNELSRIIDSSIKVLNKAILLGGTTIRSFQSSHEISGRFQNELLVHTKENCSCGAKIDKIKVGGRSTYYCPICQRRKLETYSIVSNPGEHADTEINVMWHTDLEYKDTNLIYTKVSDKNWKHAIKVLPVLEVNNTFVGIDTIDKLGDIYTQDKPFLKAVCYLKDLDKDTKYMYKVGQDFYSDIHYFKTGGNIPYNVTLIADFHSYIKLPNRLNNGMAMVDKLNEINGHTDFCFDIGDTIAWGGSYNFWQTMYENHNFFDYMWAGVNGNHDNYDKTLTKNSNRFFASMHAMPLNGYSGEEGVCYYFIYSDTLFIVIDNEYLNKDNYPFVEEWAQNIIDNNKTKYIIFVEHYQWFNLLHGGQFQYDRWKGFFDKNKVDLAISANHHIYARTTNIYNDCAVENGKGTVYVELSSSDGERGQGTWVTGDINELDTASEFHKQVIKYYYTEGRNTISGMTMNVSDDGITLKLFDRNGKELDSCFVKNIRK